MKVYSHSLHLISEISQCEMSLIRLKNERPSLTPHCPLCIIQEHDTPLFTCTPLTVPDLWTDPVKVIPLLDTWSLRVRWGFSLETWEEGLTTTTLSLQQQQPTIWPFLLPNSIIFSKNLFGSPFKVVPNFASAWIKTSKTSFLILKTMKSSKIKSTKIKSTKIKNTKIKSTKIKSTKTKSEWEEINGALLRQNRWVIKGLGDT